MGVSVEHEHFSAEEHALFAERLTESLMALRGLLARPGFGHGEASLGAEVEMHLVDDNAEPLARNAAVLERANDPRLTLEINRFNLEINAAPVALRGRPFARLHDQLTDALRVVREAAGACGARAALVGILPTLRIAHLTEGVLSDAPRYRALSRALRTIRGEPFAVHIEGRESLRAACDDVALEGANASFQVHLRAEPAAFASLFNAAQLAAAPVLAATANSPYFDGKCLWEETRVALFQQAVDTRVDARERARLPSRVAFGHGFIHDAYEPFATNVALHPVLLPVLTHEEPCAVLKAGGVPRLDELRLHHGTVWDWNRAVFDPEGDGHLRIEHRLLPSGPTLTDMIANAAFTIGLTLGLAPRMEAIVTRFSFADAERNVYATAKSGLAAELLWPDEQSGAPKLRRARELVLSLLPLAERALLDAGVEREDIAGLFDCLRARTLSGRTGAAVQRAWVEREEASSGGRPQALARMLERYLSWSARDIPVHRWEP